MVLFRGRKGVAIPGTFGLRPLRPIFWTAIFSILHICFFKREGPGVPLYHFGWGMPVDGVFFFYPWGLSAFGM